VVSKNRKKL